MSTPTTDHVTLAPRRPSWARQVAVDGALAAGLFVVLGATATDGVSVLVPAAFLGPVVLRRVAPRTSTVLAAVAGVAFLALYPQGQPSAYHVGVLVALYSAAAYTSWAFSLAALLVALVGGSVFAIALGGLSGATGVLGALFALAAVSAFTLGALRRNQFDRARAREERLRLLEAERGNHVRLAVAAERARIAREMHDVVAHSLAVVIAQADGGRYAARSSPQAAEQALETIAQTGRSALAEMRRLLGVLRDEQDGSPDRAPAPAGPQPLPEQDVPLAPQPTVDDVPALVERVRSGGLPVSLEVDGVPRAAASGVQLTAYRIVQEALTNVLKHGGPAATATVRLRWAQDRLVLEVLDDGRGAAAAPPVPGGGNGLIGMRERAGLDGGTVSAGPRPGGGFAVRAELPVP